MTGPAAVDRIAARLRGPTGWLLVALAAAWLVAVARAPEDAVQGVIQKILYVHPPLAFAAYLGFALTASAGRSSSGAATTPGTAWRARPPRWACCSARSMIVTGPIWARGTWGRWWSWDLRLTITLLLWFVYLAYLLLRGFTEGSERAARFAAVYGIVGLAVIPLNYFAIELSGGRAIHPENLSARAASAPAWACRSSWGSWRRWRPSSTCWRGASRSRACARGSRSGPRLGAARDEEGRWAT
jgi:heme exporter protein C